MNVESVRTLYAYNRWANHRTLSSLSGLSSEEFNQNFPVSFGSIRGVLVHILGVEWLYLQRWTGVSPPALPGVEEFPDLGSLRGYWEQIVTEQSRFLETLTDSKLQQRLSYINLVGRAYEYPLVDIMQHMVNHSTYHRGQIVFLLRMLGKKAVSTDYLLYFDEQGSTVKPD